MSDLSGMTDDELLAMYQRVKGGGKARAMPGSVVNKVNDDLENIGTASQINARLTPYKTDLESRKLDLGPIRNKVYEAQNWAGLSNPQSVEYASFRGDLEKMRNDSLRLNKGVQTEGDAGRAWNELFKNLHDEKVVAARLGQIQQYNEAAIRLKKSIVGQTRSQYGQPEPDYSKIESPPNLFARHGAQPKMRVFNPKSGRIE